MGKSEMNVFCRKGAVVKNEKREKAKRIYFVEKGQLTKVVSSDYGRLERPLISFRKIFVDICSLKGQIW